MRLVLLGPPGAGKGTQATVLSSELGIPHISTGDLFRKNMGEETELGLEAKKYVSAGKLVPDSVTNDMVRDRLSDDDTRNGFLLDGFPRTLSQADVLSSILDELGHALDAVLAFDVDEDIVVERMLARGRDDDNEDVIRDRLEIYRNETAPLLDHYGDLVTHVAADGRVEQISARALAALAPRQN